MSDSDLIWQKVFNLEKQVEYLIEFQRQQIKINKNLINKLMGVKDENK